MNMKGIITPKNVIHFSSNHKILPANTLDKNLMLMRPIIESNDNNKKYKDDSNNIIEPINLNFKSNKKKNYFEALKDKIFSPGDLEPSKNESKNQKIFAELSKKLSNINNNSNSNTLKLNSEIRKLNLNPNCKYLPEKKYFLSKKKTLILDLDETLVHSAFKSFYSKEDIIFNMIYDGKEHTIHVLKRPFVDEFLEKMYHLFELVIFTASIPDYANPLLNKLDPRKRISYRLFREHCTSTGNLFIKDLRKVGRDLKDLIIIDNNPISYLYNKDNGIPILTWHSCQTDNELMKLVPLLEILSKCDDVRTIIKKVVNGNYVNFTEVNKLVNNGNKNNKEEDKENKNFFGLDNPILKSSRQDKTVLINNNNNNQNNNNNLSILNKFSNYYFDTNEKSKGDKIRESLNNEFENRKSNNLFEDKVYQEKYNTFYDQKVPSTPKNFEISTKTVFDRDKSELKEELVLPSNDYISSSSKNLNVKKRNVKNAYNKLIEAKEKVNQDENEKNSFKFEHFHIDNTNRENAFDSNPMTLPSRSVDKNYIFSYNKNNNNNYDSKLNYFNSKSPNFYLQDRNENNKFGMERNRTVDNINFFSSNNNNNNSNNNFLNKNYSNMFHDRDRFKSISGNYTLKSKFF